MTVDQDNRDKGMERMRQDALDHFIEMNGHLTKEEATKIFEDLEKKFHNFDENTIRDFKVILTKMRVLWIVKHILIFSLLLAILGFLLPKNSINIWYEPIGLGLGVTTAIFTDLFMRFYGRRKK